jgi:DNA-directed RNA polymerase specialized sigma24 family protein
LVDETLNRVARKLQEGLEIRSEDPFRYVIGVAHKVFHEVLRSEARRREALRESQYEPEPDPITDEDQARLSCLDDCLGQLGDDGEWILLFYEGEKGVRIRNRKRLAAELGITTNALRIRAHRLRAQLETCVRDCVQGGLLEKG